jgi:hypothetical protein
MVFSIAGSNGLVSWPVLADTAATAFQGWRRGFTVGAVVVGPAILLLLLVVGRICHAIRHNTHH